MALLLVLPSCNGPLAITLCHAVLWSCSALPHCAVLCCLMPCCAALCCVQEVEQMAAAKAFLEQQHGKQVVLLLGESPGKIRFIMEKS